MTEPRSESVVEAGFESSSVALASYNGQDFIREQLKSILEQTVSVTEVIISDDGSSDATLAIAAEVKNSVKARQLTKEIALRVLEHEQLGVVKNFETALAITSEDLIFLADQDDIWASNKVEKIIEEFQSKHNLLLVFTDGQIIDSDGVDQETSIFDGIHLSRSERRQLRRGDVFRVLLRRNVATGATIALRREILRLAGAVPSAWLHDEWYAIVAAAHHRIGLIEEKLICYRLHGANQVGVPGKSMKKKFSRFRQSHAERSEKLYLRALQLHEFMQASTGVSEEYRIMAMKKLEFEQARRAYPSRRLARLPLIVAQFARGNYFRYGTGVKDAVRNFLQRP